MDEDITLVDVIIIPRQFDPALIDRLGCPGALALPGLPDTPTCRRLEILGLPGNEPDGHVYATLEGRIEIGPRERAYFITSDCSDIQIRERSIPQ